MTQTEKHERRDLLKRHTAAVNNAFAICQRLGAVPDDSTVSLIRNELVVDHLFGPLVLDDEGKATEETTLDRLRYEVASAEALVEHLRIKQDETVGTLQRGAGLIVPR